MTYLSELRSSLVDAAHRQHASAREPPARHAAAARRQRWPAPSAGVWWRAVHGGRAVLVSVALGLTSTAVGAVQVGAPLGPEPQLSSAVTGTSGSAQPGDPSP
jgi:hypothetical protein